MIDIIINIILGFFVGLIFGFLIGAKWIRSLSNKHICSRCGDLINMVVPNKCPLCSSKTGLNESIRPRYQREFKMTKWIEKKFHQEYEERFQNLKGKAPLFKDLGDIVSNKLL